MAIRTFIVLKPELAGLQKGIRVRKGEMTARGSLFSSNNAALQSGAFLLLCAPDKFRKQRR